MNNCWAKVILDSIGPNGKRLITVEARYWRAIHAEVMTHRAFARNAASSRAIPFLRYMGQGEIKTPVPNCTYSYISNDPFTPEFIGIEMKGMQSGNELVEPNRSEAIKIINQIREFSLEKCKELFYLGVHKSIINRYLEPWSYITTLITATEWKNFFRLRVHPKAEKHFNKIATLIKEAIDNSIPTELKAGDWHTPYIQMDDRLAIIDSMKGKTFTSSEEATEAAREIRKRVSVGRCARLSYLTHDGKRDIDADLRIFNTLIHPKIEQDRDDDVIHSSPLEHVAQASDDSDLRSGPFVGWFQFRKEFANENVEG